MFIQNIYKIILVFVIAFTVTTNVNAKIRFGVSGNYVEVNNSNEHYLNYVRYMTVPENKQQGSIWDAGNDITGKTPVEVQAIVDAIKALETNTVQHEIYDKMKIITLEWFTFTSTDDAKKAIKLRLETIAKIKHMNQDKFYWYDDVHPYETQTVNWIPAYTNSYFWTQKSATAKVAITELCDGSKNTEGECYGAIIACIWWGASKALGSNFNIKYPGTKALNMYKFKKNTTYRNKIIKYAILTTAHIPGDWIYLKNYNYRKVISKKTNHKEFWKKKWLDSNKRYPWSGENALYIGDGKYEGLGLEDMTENEMREELRVNYNDDLANIISNGGKINGTPLQKITTGVDAKNKIIWKSHKRIHN